MNYINMNYSETKAFRIIHYNYYQFQMQMQMCDIRFLSSSEVLQFGDWHKCSIISFMSAE